MSDTKSPTVLTSKLAAALAVRAFEDALAVCGPDDQPFLAEQVAMQFSELLAQAFELRGPKGRYYLLPGVATP